MPKDFTNVRRGASIFQAPKVQSRPYVAKSASGLTDKEKEARRLKKANLGTSGSMNTSLATAGQFFSPQLSTDFLELPQSLREKRELYRHFYNTDPIVGQSIDLHTELPLSKVRLATPKPKTHPKGFKDAHDYGNYILWYFTEMCDRIKLFQRLVTMVHHYHLDGSVFVFAEDSTVDVPDDVGFDVQSMGTKSSLTEEGEAVEEPDVAKVERPDRDEQELAYYQKRYKGWDRLIVLPIDQVKVTTYSFTDKMKVELIPADRDRALLEQAKAGDEFAEEMVREIPEEVRNHMEQGKLIPLGTDADEGSFVYYLSGRRGAGEDLGQSILDRCHLPGTLVLAQRGGTVRQIPIEELDPNLDQVLSAEGRWQDFEVGVREVSEPTTVINLAKSYPPIGCTSDHRYTVLRANELVEVCAGQILSGDFLQVPAVPLSETHSRVDLAAFVSGLQQADHIVGSFERWLSLDGSLGYLIGYFLGDGYVARSPLNEIFSLVYDGAQRNSIESYTHLRPILQRLGGTIGECPGSGSPTIKLVSLHNDVFARWVSASFGYTCDDKRLPGWVYDCPKDFLWGLLRGFVDSDGDVVHKEDGSLSVRLSNSNAGLVDQLLLVCLSLKIPASKTKPTKPRWVRQPGGAMAWAKPMYAVHFTHGPSVRQFFETGFLAKKVEPAAWKNGRAGSRHVFHHDKLYYRVCKVTETSCYLGPVHSLNVHGDHSFFASWGATRNCLRVLMYREKLRQAQTQIASRAMTPKRVVWGDKISEIDVMDLREQVDLSLVDPDYSIVANYEVHWEEMGSKDRLLDLSSEYEITDKQLYAGLGVTESLLSGEQLYSGDRLKLEVINTRYLFLREMLQEYVEKHLFKPVARRKGFVEKNDWGEEIVLYPRLSFTRLPLRDSQDTYDALFNLYNKGSIDISLILEMFNIDPDDTRVKLERDLFTVNDALFNELMRGIYGAVSQELVTKTDVTDRLITTLGLKKVEPEAPPQDDRFG